MRNMLIALSVLLMLGCSSSSKKNKIADLDADTQNPHQIFIIGDSTVNFSDDHRDVDHKSKVGWGEVIGDITKGTVYNRARGGASARAFRFCPRPKQAKDDLWTRSFGPNLDLDWNGAKSVIDQAAKAGDFLLIQFGSNDKHHYGKTPNCGFGEIHGEAAIKQDYKEQLKFYINQARQKGLTPILVTPVNPRHYDNNGNIAEVREPFISYTKEVANEEGIALLDLYSKSIEEFNKLTCLNNRVEPFGPCEINSWTTDVTHFEKAGAVKVANWIKELACQNDENLCKQFK